MTTTTSTWSSRLLTEALSPVAIPAHYPKFVVSQFANTDTLDESERSLTVKYPKHSDLGAAVAGSEGSDFTTVTNLSMDTAITITPTEGAMAKAIITSRAARRAGGVNGDAFYDAFRSGNVRAVVNLLAESARRLAMMVMEKYEDDHANLLSGFSNTAGSTGTDLTVANMIAAQYTLKTLEPYHEDWAFVLTPNQIQELQLEVGATSGGIGGSVWYQQGDLSFFNQNNDAARNGYRGTFMNIPVYEYSHSLRTLANSGADVAGALLCVGRGSPRDLSAQLGAIATCDGEAMRFDLDYDASARAGELICVHEYATTELDDASAVSIITDAP